MERRGRSCALQHTYTSKTDMMMVGGTGGHSQRYDGNGTHPYLRSAGDAPFTFLVEPSICLVHLHAATPPPHFSNRLTSLPLTLFGSF